MKFTKVVLLAAAMSAMVFAQSDDAWFPTPPPPAPASASWQQNTGGRDLNFRFGGDFSSDQYWNISNDWHKIGSGSKQSGDAVSNFYAEYLWNFRAGVDVGDRFSIDVRFSNPSGYAGDLINFQHASGRYNEPTWLPIMPNAFFTWEISNLLSVRGGLLEHKGNTTLDLVAGMESSRGMDLESIYYGYFNDEGIFTTYSNWATIYNNSQAGIHFAFDFSDAFTLNATAAFPVNESRNADGSDARLIFDADLDLGTLTLSPVIHARFFRNNYEFLDGFDEDEDPVFKDRNSILWTFGLDAGLDFGMFNLGAGIALGQITENKQDHRTYSSRESMSGVLMRVSPSLDFGNSELTFDYSIGVGTIRDKEEDRDYLNEVTYRMISNDMSLGWAYRLNDHLAFGPFFGLTSSSFGGKYDWKEGDDSDKGDFERTGGWNNVRFGLNVTARF